MRGVSAVDTARASGAPSGARSGSTADVPAPLALVLKAHAHGIHHRRFKAPEADGPPRGLDAQADTVAGSIAVRSPAAKGRSSGLVDYTSDGDVG